MEYTVNKLAKIAGISTRTLRYYDQIDLLKPARVNSNGYRIYGKGQVDELQQILFYRELGFGLEEIKTIVKDPKFDREKALESHLITLKQKQRQIELLIYNVSKTIDAMKGEAIMSNEEKFQGFKNELIKENEERYGDEIRKKYGNDAIDASNAKLAGMSEIQYKKAEKLSHRINELLKIAYEKGKPGSEVAQEACQLHEEWICMFWKEGTYTKEAHKALGEMYVSDERFKAYYDKIEDGVAEFFHKALNVYCK